MTYHAFVAACLACDGTGDYKPGSVIKCQLCRGTGEVRGGSFETFWQGAKCEAHPNGSGSCHECAMQSGWYWWACFPGCLPDGDPMGPFATEAEAVADAQKEGG